MTVEAGTARYEAMRPLFVLIPAAAALFGGAGGGGCERSAARRTRSLIRPVELFGGGFARIAANDFSGPGAGGGGG